MPRTLVSSSSLAVRSLRLAPLLAALFLLSCAGWSGSSATCKDACAGGSGNHSVGEMHAFARVIKSGMRTAMLAGDGLTVRDFVHDLQSSSTGLSVALYSASGDRVYAPAAAPPARESLPAHVREVLATGKPSKPGSSGPTSFALVNEDRCKSCHPAGNIRAVMTLELAEHPAPTVASDALIPFGKVVEAAFDAMMTLGKSHEADVFMNALPKAVPGIKTAAVFSRDGRPSLGDGFMEVPPEVAKKAITPVKPFTTDLPDNTTLVTVPLPNAPRCLSCHKPSEMRGAIVLQLDKKLAREESAKFLLTSSLQHVMLTGLGRLTKKFLDDAARSGMFNTVTVHDHEGRLFHDINAKPAPPPAIAEALRTGRGSVQHTKSGTTVVLPVGNDDKCRRCHDEPGNVRAVIAVTRGAHPGGAKRAERIGPRPIAQRPWFPR